MIGRAPLLLLLLAAALLAGCSKSGPAELLETAKFEELQTNVPHARELYRRIVDEHPDSAEAKVAKERLAALESAGSSGSP